MKPSKHQRCKQRCQAICGRVHDRLQSSVLRPSTMHELRNQNVSLDRLLSRNKKNKSKTILWKKLRNCDVIEDK